MKENKEIKTPYYVALIFIAFPVMYVVTRTYPVWSLVPLIAFVGSYLWILEEKKEWINHILWSVMLAYLLYSSLFLSPTMLMFMFFFSNLLVWRLKAKLFSYYTLSFVVVHAGIFIWIMLLKADLEYKIFMIVMSIAMYIMTVGMFYIRQKEELEKERYQANEYINLLLAENERNRIGRDLHDTLGHVFATISLKSELASTLLEQENYEQLAVQLNELQMLTRNSMQDVRQLVQSLKYQSLAMEIESSKELLSLTNIQVEVIGSESTISLPESLQSQLVMLLRECVNNIIKHSKATAVTITTQYEKTTVLLRISDNGVGFREVNATTLSSLKERVRLLGGRCEIISAHNPTVIELIVPYQSQE